MLAVNATGNRILQRMGSIFNSQTSHSLHCWKLQEEADLWKGYLRGRGRERKKATYHKACVGVPSRTPVSMISVGIQKSKSKKERNLDV